MPIKAFYVDNNMILYSRQVILSVRRRMIMIMVTEYCYIIIFIRHFDKYKFRMIKMPKDILNDDENRVVMIESSEPGVLQS